MSLGTPQRCSGACGQVLAREAKGGPAPTSRINGQGIESLLEEAADAHLLIWVVVTSVFANVKFHTAVCAVKVSSLYSM